VRDVGDEAPLALLAALERVGHPVERPAQFGHLVPPDDGDPAGQVALAEPPGRLGQPLDGAQHAVTQQRRTQNRQDRDAGRGGDHRPGLQRRRILTPRAESDGQRHRGHVVGLVDEHPREAGGGRLDRLRLDAGEDPLLVEGGVTVRLGGP
jgi:hypothetical protein